MNHPRNQQTLSAVVVGARTRRQGTGPFIAAGLQAAGIHVRGIVGTSESSVAQAQAQLAAQWQLETEGFTHLEAALDATGAEVVAICSPWQVHQVQLQQVAAAGRHCLVEKPLAWPLSEEGASALIAEFERQNTLLQVVNQWPTTLPAFAELFPEANSGVQQFAMRLSPLSIGPDGITDSAPHFIGMLQALAGPGECTDTVLDRPSDEEWQLRCRYRHSGGSIAASLMLKTQEQRPRPAWYEIDGQRVDRQVELPEYRQYLSCGTRRIAIPDPMQQVTLEFVRRLRDADATAGDLLRAAHRNLLQLATATQQ